MSAPPPSSSGDFLPSGDPHDDRWLARFDVGCIARALQSAHARGQLGEEDTSVVLYDMDLLDTRLDALRASFPADTLHAIAIKANPHVAILRHAARRGFGLEAASIEEVALAQAAGCNGERIVFDAPAKTDRELAAALAAGYHVNVDSFAELDRIAQTARATGLEPKGIGLRVNPVVGAGAIAATSVAAYGSRFGVDLERERAEIVGAFRRHPWLDSLHVHVGSQGVSLSQLCEAGRRIACLADEVDEVLGHARIRSIDIGGGLPARMTESAKPPTIAHYGRALVEAAPSLFTERRRLITEFGRAIHTGCAVVVSRVEVVKQVSDRPMVVVHVGADMFLRRVYAPNDWDHEMMLLEPDGMPVTDRAEEPCDIVGPLCFAGDVLARRRPLPSPRRGDRLVIRDVGAYTTSMWSRHCNRARPTVLGIRAAGHETSVLCRRESLASIVASWEGDP